MFEWLWHQIKGLNTLRRITDKVRESSQRSKKRSFDWIWIQIAEELGNEAMVKMLTEAQAQADRTGGAFGLDFHLDTHTLGKSRRRGYAFSEGN
jgi:hypothetical protein